MSNGFKIALGFISGVLVGGFAMKKYIDKKYGPSEYEEIVPAEKEDDSVQNEPEQKTEVKTDNRVKYTQASREEYREFLNKYDGVEEVEEDIPEDEIPSDCVMYTPRNAPIIGDVPYNISPDEYMEIDSYETAEYTLYADGYVTDETGTPCSPEDVLNALGDEFENWFGTYENDQVWVRNDRLHMDFSVIKDLDKYEDVCPARFRKLVFG